MDNRYHVAPINDTRKHNTDGPDCWCKPRIEGDLVVHNAADGREFFEELDEEEKRAIQAGLEDIAAGRLHKWEDVRRKLDYSPIFKTYLFEYEFDGETWGFEVKAASSEEAVRRVRALSSQALLLGEERFSIPAFPGSGLISRAIVAIRNLFL